MWKAKNSVLLWIHRHRIAHICNSIPGHQQKANIWPQANPQEQNFGEISIKITIFSSVQEKWFKINVWKNVRRIQWLFNICPVSETRIWKVWWRTAMSPLLTSYCSFALNPRYTPHCQQTILCADWRIRNRNVLISQQSPVTDWQARETLWLPSQEVAHIGVLLLRGQWITHTEIYSGVNPIFTYALVLPGIHLLLHECSEMWKPRGFTWCTLRTSGMMYTMDAF